MPRRKPLPFRTGYKNELGYPKRAVYLPTHGFGPRCRVDFKPSDDGPWSMLKIMEVVENDKVEEYTCAMPRYYAVPLILMNKRLAFFEASCHPDGTPILPPSPPTARTDNNGGGCLRKRDLLEYSYLWHLRTLFLQAVFDMNHERRLDERWRYVKIHGFVYRLYRRYGHEDNQRILYWRNEIKAGRVPYGTPDIADMGMCLPFSFHVGFFSIARALFFSHTTPFFLFSLYLFPSIPPSVHSMKARPAVSWLRTGYFIYPHAKCEIKSIVFQCCASPGPWESASITSGPREVRQDDGRASSRSPKLSFLLFLFPLLNILFFFYRLISIFFFAFYFILFYFNMVPPHTLDWESYIVKEMASGSAHINGFLWNSISQGYARVLKDETPQEAWRTWRRLSTSRDSKPALYPTPTCSPSPVRDLSPTPSVGSASAHDDAAGSEREERTQTESRSQAQAHSSTCGPPPPPPPPPLLLPPPLNAQGTVTAATGVAGDASGSVAAAGRCARINGDGDEDDGDATMEYEVMTEALTRGHAQAWTLPFSVSGLSSEAAGSGIPGPLCHKEILLKFDAPENLKLSAIRCTFSREEDVGEDFSGVSNFAYGCHADPSFVRNATGD